MLFLPFIKSIKPTNETNIKRHEYKKNANSETKPGIKKFFRSPDAKLGE